MHPSLGSAIPAPQIHGGRIHQHLTNRIGPIEKAARQISRRAAAWLANSRTWAPHVPASSAAFGTRFAGELEAVRRDMLARTGVAIVIGASRSASVARTASRLAGTQSVIVVAPGHERAFLAPLPLRRLDGISRTTLQILDASGMVTIGELQRVPKAALQAEFGHAEGLHLWRAARGLECESPAERRLDLVAEANINNREPSPEAALLGGVLRLPWHGLFAGWRGFWTSVLRGMRLTAGTAK
jgi:DNA polymerase-iota, thumb domain